MGDKKHHVCPAELAGVLDNRLRRWIQDPAKILRPYIKEGMTVLDLGCGPGFFSIAMAELVGKSGRVIASDFQEGMLRKLRNKIRGMELEERILLHKCEENKIGLSGKVDFVFVFYVAHEVPDQDRLFNEIASVLKPGGQVLMAEPSFHVSKRVFEESIKTAQAAGLVPIGRPEVFFSKAVLMKKGNT